MRRTLARALPVALVALVLVGCSDAAAEKGPPPAKRGGSVVFVSLGGAETSGTDLDYPEIVEARWTQVLYRDSLPTRAVHVNLAQGNRTVGDGVVNQLPLALEVDPTIATVWFGPDDEASGTPVEVFEADLRTIVHELLGSGARVFVATGTGTRYDDAISRVTRDEGATAVAVSGLPRPLGRTGHADAAARFVAAIGEVT